MQQRHVDQELANLADIVNSSNETGLLNVGVSGKGAEGKMSESTDTEKNNFPLSKSSGGTEGVNSEWRLPNIVNWFYYYNFELLFVL